MIRVVVAFLGVVAALVVLSPAALAGKRPYRYIKVGHIGAAGHGKGQFPSGVSGVAIDQTCGDVYMSDESNRVIHRYDENGRFLNDIGVPHSLGRGGIIDPRGIFIANATVEPSNLQGPPIDCGGEGILWVADPGASRLDAFDAGGRNSGRVESVWCGATNPSGVCDVTNTSGPEFDPQPVDVWTTGERVWAAGQVQHKIFEYKLDGTYVASGDAAGAGYDVAVASDRMWSNYGAPNAESTLALWSTTSAPTLDLVHVFRYKHVSALATGIDGQLYVIDGGSLRVFSPGGIPESTTSIPYSSDGIAVRYDGTVYITSSYYRAGADVYSPGPLVTLKKIPGGKHENVLSGAVAPNHYRGDKIELQRIEGRGWRTFAKVTLNRHSAYLYHWTPPHRRVHYSVRAFFHDPVPHESDRDSAILDVATR